MQFQDSVFEIFIAGRIKIIILPQCQEYPPSSDQKDRIWNCTAHIQSNVLGVPFLLFKAWVPQFVEQYDMMSSGVSPEPLIRLTLLKCMTLTCSEQFFAHAQLIIAEHITNLRQTTIWTWFQLLSLGFAIQCSIYVFRFFVSNHDAHRLNTCVGVV